MRKGLFLLISTAVALSGLLTWVLFLKPSPYIPAFLKPYEKRITHLRQTSVLDSKHFSSGSRSKSHYVQRDIEYFLAGVKPEELVIALADELSPHNLTVSPATAHGNFRNSELMEGHVNLVPGAINGEEGTIIVMAGKVLPIHSIDQLIGSGFPDWIHMRYGEFGEKTARPYKASDAKIDVDAVRQKRPTIKEPRYITSPLLKSPSKAPSTTP